MSDYLDYPVKKTFAEIGLDDFGQSHLQFSGSEVNQKALSKNENSIASTMIQDGDVTVRLSVFDGYLQSSDYESGVKGWKLTPKDGLEASNGVFRGQLSAATGTFAGKLEIKSGADTVILLEP